MSRTPRVPFRLFTRAGVCALVIALTGVGLPTTGFAQEPISVDFEPKVSVGTLADFTPFGGADTPDGTALAELILHGRNFNLETLNAKAVALPEPAAFAPSKADPKAIAKPDLRYKLLKFTGRLTHVARVALPAKLKAGGVARLYEATVSLAGWDTPVYLAVAALPEGVFVGPQPPAAPPVTGAAYFVKVARHPTAAALPGSEDRSSPVFAAPTFAVVSPKSRYDFDGNRSIYKGIVDFTSLREGDPVAEGTAYDDLVRHVLPYDAKDLAEAATEIPVTEFLRREWATVPSKMPGAPAEKRLALKRPDLRFKLWKVSGQLKRIVPIPVSDELREAGVKNLYEVWLVLPDRQETVCAVVTELPPGVTPTPDLKESRTATIAGYFLKVIRYESGTLGKDKKPEAMFAPLFIARSFTDSATPAPDAGHNWRTVFLPGILTGLGLLTALLLGLAWWFRASDRASRKAVEARQVNPFPDNGPDAAPPPPPGAPSG